MPRAVVPAGSSRADDVPSAKGAWRVARRLLLALGIAGLIVVAGGSLVGLDGFLTARATGAARHENRALRAEQVVWREQAFDLAGRLFETAKRVGQVTRGTGHPGHGSESQCLQLPPRDAADETLLAWLDDQSSRLAALGAGLTDVGPYAGGDHCSDGDVPK
ncbi:MAG TPA: hypothetical protein VF017_15065 [Thermoanaerobaculia bacterium]|nr:hypothetical protein [Thermoanaerobaculia bacterium]